MSDSFVSAVAAETAKVETEKRKAEMETNARVEGLAAQARMREALEEQLRGAEAAEKQRKEQEAAGARRREEGLVVAVALMVRAPLTEAIKLAMVIQPLLDTAETPHARPDLGIGVQRLNFIHAKLSPLLQAGLAAKEQYTWCEKDGVKFRFERAQRRPDGVRWVDGPRVAPAPAPARASVPAWKGPQPDLYPSGEDKSGSKWVRGTTYAAAVGAGDAISARVLARLAQAEKNIEKLMGEKVPPKQARELSLESELERVEQERGSLAAELKAATDKGLEQDQKFQALQAEAKGHMAEIASLRKHMEIKNQEIDKLRQEKQVWMSRSHKDCLMDTPPRHFDFSTPAALSTPGQEAHEAPTRQLDMSGASAMASSPQGADGQSQVAAGVPESAAPAALAPLASEAREARPKSPPWQQVRVGRLQSSPKQAAAALSPSQQRALENAHIADLVAALPVPAWLRSPGGQVPIGWTGPRPEAATEKTQRQTKEENAAMRAARLEGQSLEPPAVALQGKRPPPAPSPASKATLAQEGPSKAPAIEDDSSETDEAIPGGDDGQ
jgi:hypothetical protein